ncbi:MAG TPA: YciI family protein [Thermomicrobiales bacterium]|nr:YciI family protein [Thermomicrobiales bacterium]
MALFAVMISFGDEALRDQVRPVHRVFLKEQHDAGRLVESGPFVDDTGALLIYQGTDEVEVRELLAQDPYFQNDGVVASVVVKEWNVVFPRKTLAPA